MDEHSYDDIINLPNPTSKNHPRMSLHDRAAQFAPFMHGFTVRFEKCITCRRRY